MPNIQDGKFAQAVAPLYGQIDDLLTQRDKYEEGDPRYVDFDTRIYAARKQIITNAIDYDQELTERLMPCVNDYPEMVELVDNCLWRAGEINQFLRGEDPVGLCVACGHNTVKDGSPGVCRRCALNEEIRAYFRAHHPGLLHVARAHAEEILEAGAELSYLKAFNARISLLDDDDGG